MASFAIKSSAKNSHKFNDIRRKFFFKRNIFFFFNNNDFDIK